MHIFKVVFSVLVETKFTKFCLVILVAPVYPLERAETRM